MPISDDFSKIQSLYFEAPEEEKFRHQISHPYFSLTERALWRGFEPLPGERVLEVGCGEGGNLFFLRGHGTRCFGIDLFIRKLIFAKQELPDCQFACCLADHLPFADGSFDAVLCRDVLHHLADRDAALQEMVRVCKRGGRMIIIEPNGRNPLMRLQPLLIKAEQGIQWNSIDSLLELLRRRAGGEARLTMRQPLPLFRLALHYRYGWPRLGHWRPMKSFFNGVDRLAAKMLPRRRWAYLILEICKK